MKIIPTFISKITVCILLLCSLATNIAHSQTMSRQDKLFIQKGVQYPSWVRNDHASEGVVVPVRQELTIGRTGRYVRIQLSNTQILSLAEVQVFSGGTNIAAGKVTQQSSNKSGGNGLSNLAVDGNTDGNFTNNSVTHTLEGFAQMEPWWQVDLNSIASIDSVVIWNRTDCCGQRLKGYYLFVSDNAYTGTTLASSMAQLGVAHYVQPITGFATHIPTAIELNNAYIAPTYFEIPAYNYEVHHQDPNVWWSIAKGGKDFYGSPNRAPSAFEQSNGFLNTLQAANINKAYSFCIGDEEGYSTTNTSYVKGWFDIIRDKYPNVLFHTNQYIGQWNYSQMQTYMQTAQPDLLTFDMYYFHYAGGPSPTAGNSYTRLFQDMAAYRSWGLGGYDGTGNAPIPFGGYVQAFSGDNSGTYAAYQPSESEVNLNTFAYLTLGAKWVNVWIYYALFWNGTTGSLTPEYYHFANVGRQLNKLSPHLSRLRTTDVRFIPGQNTSGTNVSPNNISQWNATVDPYVTGITATNLGTFNGGLKGDVLVGYFKPVPGIANTAGITMAPVVNIDTKYFMLLNGLTKPNGPGNNSVDTVQGKANLVRQKITLNIDFGANPIDTLYRVNRNSGLAEMMNLALVSGSQYTVVDTLDGGVADLFYWKNQGSPAQTTGKAVQVSTGYISAGNVTQLNNTNKFTIESWVKFNNINLWGTVFCKMLDGNNRILLQTGPNNVLYANVSNGINSYGYTASNIVTTNQWYHLAMVYDGTQTGNSNRLKLFINGIQTGLTFDQNIPATTTTTNSQPLIVASASTTGTGNYINGVIDEVRVWNTALSSATIATWKNKNLGSCHPNIANLQLYWPLNDDGNPSIAAPGLSTTYTGAISAGNYVTGQVLGVSGCTSGLMSSNTVVMPQVLMDTEPTEKQAIYPNPVEGILNVRLYKNQESQATVTVFNSMRQVIFQTKKALNKGENQMQIDLTNRTPGLYILQVKDVQGETQFKVIKK